MPTLLTPAGPSERTVYRVMDQIGLSHRPKRKPNGLTKADREAMKSDDLLKRDFHSDAPLEKCITDITEIPACNGKLYVSAIFDCFDLSVLGLAMGTNMKADLCIHTLENALTAYPTLEGAIIHSDRGTQYTSESYRQTIREHHIHQSMNSAGGRCHDNARCESMWAAEQLAVTDEVLSSLDCESIPQLVVYNKCDTANTVAFDPDILLTSAKTGYGLPALLAKLDEVLNHRVRTIEIVLPYDKLALADILRSRGSVAAEEYREDGVYYRGTVKIDDLHRFEEFLV